MKTFKIDKELTGLEINCIQVAIDHLIDHLGEVLKADKEEVLLPEAKLCAEETAERLASAENVKKAFDQEGEEKTMNYRVEATQTSDVFQYIEATSAEEALQIAKGEDYGWEQEPCLDNLKTSEIYVASGEEEEI